MGAIEDTYEDLDADVPFEEFEAAVEAKVEQMGGLADEETAAMLVAHELADEEVNAVADIKPGMDDVKFLAKVVRVGELRTFDREGEDEDGRVLNVDVADESGQVRIALWDAMAADAAQTLQVGDVLRIAGRPKEGYNGLEVSVTKAEPDVDAEVNVEVDGESQVENLTLGMSDVTLVGQVLDTESVRTFERDDGSEGKVSNLVLGDETGRVRVTLWDSMAERVEVFSSSETVEVVDGYVRERDGELELHVGDRGTVDAVDAEVTYEPDTTDIGDVAMGETVDLAGGVIETGEKRTFERDDGSTGQVRNIRLTDDTGEIRVALWGEKADREIDLADRVVLTDVEIQDGWQDELEASAGWRSTVTVLDTEPTTPGTDDSGEDSAQGGLDAFAGGSASDSADSASAAGVADAADETDASDDGIVEFTGTVVQAGDPVVLDDGTETWSVETDEQLRLGEEVTVRGSSTDGRIDAEDVF